MEATKKYGQQFKTTKNGRPIYVLANGTRVPGVTTINKNIGWSADGLKHWAWECGMRGEDYREVMEEAAGVGKAVHALVEGRVKGQPVSIADLQCDEATREQLRNALGAWDEWFATSRYRPIGAEVSYVSETWRFGGTMDVAMVADTVSLLDLKSGSSIYAETLIQVRAYAALWNEHNPTEPITHCHALRVGKDDGSFHHHCWPIASLEPAWAAFGAALVLHEAHKSLKKKAA